MVIVSENIIAWVVYISISILALLLFWHMTNKMKWLWWRDILRISVAVILLVPVPVDPIRVELAPAFLVLAFAGLNQSLEQAQRAGFPLLLCLLIFYIGLSLHHLLLRLNRRQTNT